MRVEWHPAAVADLGRIGAADQTRIRNSLSELGKIEDARQRMVAYSGPLKGFWKFRVGDYRLVCRLENQNGQSVLIIHLAHRSVAYKSRSTRTVLKRGVRK